MPRPWRAIGPLTLCLAAAACGTGRVVLRHPCTLHLDSGQDCTVLVHERQNGALEIDEFEPALLPAYLLSFVLFDWIDTAIVCPTQAVRALCFDDLSIQGGLLGWLYCLTPCASLTLGMQAPTRELFAVDAIAVRRLQAATGEERSALVRALFPPRILDVEFP